MYNVSSLPYNFGIFRHFHPSPRCSRLPIPQGRGLIVRHPGGVVGWLVTPYPRVFGATPLDHVARKRAPLPGCFDIGRSFPRGYNGGQVGRGSGHPCRGASLDDETIGPCAAQVHFPPQTLSLDRMAMVWAPARGASLSTLYGKESGFSTAQYTRWRRVQRRRPLQNGLSPKKRCVFCKGLEEAILVRKRHGETL